MTQHKLVPNNAQAEDIFGSALSNMPDEYLECRDIAHDWKVIRDFHIVDAEKDLDVQPRLGHAVFVRRLIVCRRCGKKRNDAFLISSQSRWQALERLNTTYSQPAGFAVKGAGHLSGARDMVRGERFRRVVTQGK